MATLHEIKGRMKSIQDTQKITNAMYLIASNEMRKTKLSLDEARPYFAALRREIKRVFRTLKSIDHPYFYPEDMNDFDNGTYGVLIITSDKSLAGNYNQAVLQETQKIVDSHKDVKLFVVGEYGRHYFRDKGFPLQKGFDYSAANPTLQAARNITDLMLSQYDDGILKKIFVIYTSLANGFTEEVISTRLLPFHRDYFDDSKQEEEVKHDFEFLPSPAKVLEKGIVSYLEGFIYGALVDSFASEENSRIRAMSQANDNAKNLIEALSLEANQIRQAKITEEINEISAGAKAQQKDRMKRV